MHEPAAASKRLFVALELPESLTRAIGEACRSLAHAHRLKWVAPEKLHLTLAFLGPTPAEAVGRIEAVLDACAASTAPFTLSLGGAGTFGRPSHPRVLWLAVDGELEPARALEARLSRELSLPKEHEAWTPHLTLARAKARGGDASLARAAEAWPKLELPPFRLDAATLFESASGRYQALGRAPFRGR